MIGVFKVKRTYNWLAAGCLISAVATWASPAVPSGPMADYYLQCGWAGSHSEAGCAALAERLEALEWPSPAERLALLLSRYALSDWRGDANGKGEFCAGAHAIVAEIPGYAEAWYRLGVFCASHSGGEYVALLRRVLEIEPDNYEALSSLLFNVEWRGDVAIDDPGSLATYREALYESARKRSAWQAAGASNSVDPRFRWNYLFEAAAYVVEAALREGDLDAAEAMRDRVRRDTGLDELDYGVADNVVVACQPIHILEDACLSAVERLAGRISADGLPLTDALLAVVEEATERLRRHACSESTGQPRYGFLLVQDECLGPGSVTETDGVAGLRAVLEHHGGPWSSEHHRVYAQGFLGDGARREGLREALRLNPGNGRAQCDLAQALSGEDPEAAATVLGEEGDPSCLDGGQLVWGDASQR